MATVPRAPLITPVLRPNYDPALSAVSRGQDLTVTPVDAVVYSRLPAIANPLVWAQRYPPDLFTWTQSSLFSLINVQPAAGIAWLDFPLLIRSQQPEYSGRNLALFGSPAVKPFAQTEWPNPTQPDRMLRAFNWAGDDCNMNLINSPKPFSQVNWPNPIPDPRAARQPSTYTDPLTHYPVIQIPAPPYSPQIIWGRQRDRRYRRFGR